MMRGESAVGKPTNPRNRWYEYSAAAPSSAQITGYLRPRRMAARRYTNSSAYIPGNSRSTRRW